MCYLPGITIEHQGLSLREFAKPPFPCLTPARMVNTGIYICIKSVFPRDRLRPCGSGHILNKPYPDDRLYTFKSILPWNYQPYWSAILIRQYLAIHTQ